MNNFKFKEKLLSFKEVWPVNKSELCKVLVVGLAMACILFICSTTRVLKDSLILNIPLCSNSTIATLKIWGVLPGAFISWIIYQKLVKKFNYIKIFYFLISFFSFFYFIFGLILYPLLKFCYPITENLNKITQNLPSMLREIVILSYFPEISIFYILSDIFGCLVLGSLFWQLAEKTCKKNKCGKFFFLYILVGNFGVIFSGLLGNLVASSRRSVLIQMVAISFAGILILFLIKYINKNYALKQNKKDECKNKIHNNGGFFYNFKHMFCSKYVLLINVVVICYGICLSICEITFRNELKDFKRSEISDVLASSAFFTGVFTILFSLLGSFILSRLKWKISALLTPVCFLILGGGLFLILITKSGFNLNLGNAVIFIGIFQESFSRSLKFSFFDTTKQMLFSSLNKSVKNQSRFSVEIISNRFGKEFGSFMIIISSSVFGAFVSLSILFSILIFTSLLWIFSITMLDNMYKKRIENKIKKAG